MSFSLLLNGAKKHVSKFILKFLKTLVTEC